jgi:hypothetical protein
MSSTSNNDSLIQDTTNLDSGNTDSTQENTSKETVENTIAFFNRMMYQLLNLFIVLLVGTAILYGCKVSQSNILPIDLQCFPYISTETSVKEIPINMNTTYLNGGKYSQKIYFPYEYNKNNSLLDFLRRIKESPKATSVAAFLVDVVMSFIQFNYSLTNGFYSILNTYLPESIILLFSPFFLLPCFLFFIFLDFFYFMYAWFSNMSWLFKRNTNNTDTGKPIWKSVDLLEPFSYFFSWFLLFLFFWIYILGFGFIFSILLLISLTYTFLTPLGMTGFIKINNAFHKISLFQFFKDILKDKKQMIMILFSIITVLSSFTYFNWIVSIIFTLIFVLFWFGIIPNNLYVNNIPENLSKVASYNVAEKLCNQPKKTVLNNIWNLFRSPNQQKGGASPEGEFIHSLKKLSKRLNINV